MGRDPSRHSAIPVSLLVVGSFCWWHGKAVGAGGRLKGVAELTWWRPKLCGSYGCHMSVGFSFLQQTAVVALLVICQCDVGLRRKTVLASTTSWDD